VQPLLPAGASALDVALPSRRDEARFGPVGSAEGNSYMGLGHSVHRDSRLVGY
jgi:hypothetical protein